MKSDFASTYCMPRALTISQSEFPYNISARCINKEWFNLPMEIVWEIFSSELGEATKENNLVVHSFVLMSNHFHLIASTPDANISHCMHRFMMNSSRKLTRMGNRINQTFAGRHYKTILQHPNYFLNAYKYNYRNPVAAGICEKVEDYPYSTLTQVVGRKNSQIILAEDTTFLSAPEETLKWLNTPPNPELLEATRCGMRGQFFKSRLSKKTGEPVISEMTLI